nr:CehA/McbA family metallohydrolase [Qipengyuania qiaonensis]
MPPSPTAGRGPGWYRGDLHMHTGHSDGSCDSLAGRRVPCPLFRTVETAKARRLDFISITEHNTTSHASALFEAQNYFDDMLLIPGREITTFFGHFNIFGITSPIDFRITEGGEISFNSIADRVHELDGIVSINHPGLPSGEICMGCGWTMDDVDYAKVDAMELVNGSSLASTDRDAEGSISAIPFWTKRLEDGFALTPLGGSDNHDPDVRELGAIGHTLTVIEARDLTPQALFDGIRHGRSFVVVDPSVAPLHLDFSATGEGRTARMGGTLQLNGPLVRVMPDVQAPEGSTIEVYDGSRLIADLPLANAAGGVEVELASGHHPVHLRIRSASGALLAVGNALRIETGER